MKESMHRPVGLRLDCETWIVTIFQQIIVRALFNQAMDFDNTPDGQRWEVVLIKTRHLQILHSFSV